MLTTDPNNPDLGRGVDTKKVEQNKAYLILSEAERKQGFIRPVRTSYVHTGKKVQIYELLDEGLKLEDLSDTEKEEYKQWNWTHRINYTDEYKKNHNIADSTLGVIIEKKEFDAFISGKHYLGACGVKTTMGLAIAETYARNPKFYGSTYCCGCSMHLPVAEFTWDGTEETVGS